MQSKYSLYVKEREGLETHEDHRGFFTYRVINNGIFEVVDLFILPGFRGRGVGTEYANLIENMAKEFNCNTVYCYSCIEANNWKDSDGYIRAHGYKKTHTEDNMVYYCKEL